MVTLEELSQGEDAADAGEHVRSRSSSADLTRAAPEFRGMDADLMLRCVRLLESEGRARHAVSHAPSARSSRAA